MLSCPSAGIRPLQRLFCLGLVLVGSSLASAPALAAGCHVPDRPVLGLTAGWLAGDVPGATTTHAVMGRRPCSGVTPVSASLGLPARDLAASSIRPLTDPAAPRDRVIPTSDPLRPLRVVLRTPRPPRAA